GTLTPPNLMINRFLRPLHRVILRGLTGAGLLLAAGAGGLPAQGPLAKRLDRVLDQPPFDRATWGVIVMDSAGKTLFERNANRLFIPASNMKLLVTATASALLGPAFRVTTSLYGAGTLQDGVLSGDLVAYGRGNPMFSS